MKLGEVVLLKTSHRGKIREFITSVSEDKFHTDFGMIEMSELLEKGPGDTVVSHMGQEFVIQLPRMPDFFRHAKRTGAPIMPKDIGMILGYTGINRNDVVLDAGVARHYTEAGPGVRLRSWLAGYAEGKVELGGGDRLVGESPVDPLASVLPGHILHQVDPDQSRVILGHLRKLIRGVVLGRDDAFLGAVGAQVLG